MKIMKYVFDYYRFSFQFIGCNNIKLLYDLSGNYRLMGFHDLFYYLPCGIPFPCVLPIKCIH